MRSEGVGEGATPSGMHPHRRLCLPRRTRREPRTARRRVGDHRRLKYLCSHTNTSSCTLDAGGDAPYLTSKETRPKARSDGSSESTPTSQSQLLHFIKSTFGTLEGKNHCWLNAVNGIWKTFNQEGMYLVLLYQSHETLDGDCKHSAAFRKLKYLHQRYPHLNVFAMQYGSGISSLATQSQAVRTIMEEYITFPILLSSKDFTNMTNGACYLLFEGSKDHIIFTKLDGDPDLMIRGMEGFSALSAEPIENVVESGVPWQKEEVVKEPYVGSLRNLLLYHPGGLSVDEDGDRIFISDSNHHRIIISNCDGVILDCIGSSPGFEDGEFESAKLLHPAASFYHAAEDCLYIVDSENHAVRKADFGRRFLETVYPVFNKKGSGVWSWIIDKLGLTKEDASKKDDASNIQDFDAEPVVFPWHLLKISEDDLLVADRSFETSWILSMSTGEKKNIVRDGQRVQKHDLDTKETSNIHFTNVGVLGLPYWFVCRLEKVSTWGHSAGQFQDHNRKVNVLPGRCNIKVSVDIPVDTELATPLVESCIWRQVRGSGAEISESDAQDTTSEKVGIAQQWYDEIDNLAFSEAAEEPAVHKGDDKPADESHQDQKSVHFTCAVNVSPGTCELVASAALYLKVDRTKADHEDQKAVIKRILQCQGHEEHVGVELLTENHIDARDLVIMKPVHLRLRMECADHPAGTTNKETISTESSLEISITLE
ncbi:unnamed protein product [Triticum turgidum subsp. durum]|uniref:NHL repeat-containing protein 2 n=1 Tax=Triticum turgidum subsp. durum TaxID=4567 RepID=A0A9R1BPB6_TRITD|nr:unnamed protein product [Triticum turgidum subsp. durum]